MVEYDHSHLAKNKELFVMSKVDYFHAEEIVYDLYDISLLKILRSLVIKISFEIH